MRAAIGLAALILVGGCSRSFSPPSASNTAAPSVRDVGVAPKVVRAGQPVQITFSSDRSIAQCAAQVLGQPAACAASGKQCSCTFTVPPSLPQGTLSVQAQVSDGRSTGSGTGSFVLDTTAPELLGGLHLRRGALSAPDTLVVDADAAVDPPLVSGQPYDGQRVTTLNVWSAASGGTRVAQVAFSGSGVSVAIDGGYAHLWVSAVDVPGNESDRAQVLDGDDSQGPVLGAASARIVRKPLGEVDLLQIDPQPDAGGCAIASYAVLDADDAGVGVLDAAGDGGLAVGTPTRSYARLFVVPTDRCGLSGARVEAQNSDVDGPVIDGARVTWFRRPLGQPDGISGAPGAVVDVLSAVREVRVYDGPDSGTLLAAFTPDADGGFATADAGDVSPERLWLEATDKPGNVSARVYARSVDAVLNLAGRTSYDDTQSPVQLFSFAAERDPRTASPGLAGSVAAEAPQASQAAGGNGVQQVATTAIYSQGSLWSGFQLPPGPSTLAYDQLRQRTVLVNEAIPSCSTVAGGAYSIWEDDGLRGWQSAPVVLSPSSWPNLTLAAYDSAVGGTVLVFNSGSSRFLFTGAGLADQSGLTGPVSYNGPMAMADDATRHKLVLVNEESGFETWEFDGTQWALVTTAHHPAASGAEVALAYDAATHQTLLYYPNGGQLWAYDGSDWLQLSMLHTPPARSSPALAYDAAHGRLVLFGGLDLATSADFQDTWAYDGADWSPVITAHAPPARHGAGMVFAQGRGVILEGGQAHTDTGCSGNPGELSLGDTWSFDGSDWAPINPPSPSPDARFEASMVFDAALGKLVMFGGANDDRGERFADTWTLADRAWTQLAPATSPSPRSGQAAAYDAARGKLVVFGGNDGSLPLNDTWELDAQGWTQRSTALAPEPRFEASMAYDPVRGRVVLFGGSRGGYLYGDTWEYDGASWTRRDTVHAPGPRNLAGLAYDPVQGRMVLSGGNSFDGTPYGDTWSYDGQDWTLLATSTAADCFGFGFCPNFLPAASGKSMAFDPEVVARDGGSTQGGVFSFGGVYASSGAGMSTVYGTLGAWELDDALWFTLDPYTQSGNTASQSGEPPGRSGAALAYDPSQDAMVVFGGLAPPVTSYNYGAGTPRQFLGDTSVHTVRTPHSRFAAQSASVKLAGVQSLSSLAVRYVGHGSGDADAGTAAAVSDAQVLLWRDGAWAPVADDADGGSVSVDPPADLDGGFGSYLAGGDRLWLLAVAPPSSAPGLDGGVSSTLETDDLEIRARYTLP